MKLYYSKTSPFARKVRMLFIEWGITERVQFELVSVLDDALSTPNPLGKIPCLELEDGTQIYDSPVICEYVEAQMTGQEIDRDARYWAGERLQALCDGIMDAAFNSVMERNRDAAQQSSFWLSRWRGAVERSVAEASRQATPVLGRMERGQIALACALGYLDFRMADFDWRTAYPSLADWYEAVSSRDSVVLTSPTAP